MRVNAWRTTRILVFLAIVLLFSFTGIAARSPGLSQDTGSAEDPLQVYTLNVGLVGEGTIYQEPAGTYFAPGTTVSITVVPAEGWVFNRWAGPHAWPGGLSDDYSPATTLIMDADKVVSAYLHKNLAEDTLAEVPDQNLRNAISAKLGKYPGEPLGITQMAIITHLNAQELGVTSLSGLEHCVNMEILNLYQNAITDISPLRYLSRLTVLTLNSNTIQDITPLVENTGLGAGDKVWLTYNMLDLGPGTDMDNIAALQARGVQLVYEPQNIEPPATFTLTVQTEGGGWVDVQPARPYLPGTVVSLNAIPSDGYVFSSWTGGVADPAAPQTTITMNADAAVTAYFTLLPELVLTVTIEGQGQVDCYPAAPYTAGDIVTLTAMPGEGWLFSGWTGNVADAAAPQTTITLDSDAAVTARFVQAGSPVLNITVSGLGRVDCVPAGPYTVGTTVVLTAVPEAGYVFSGWSGDISGAVNPFSLVLDASKNITAIFTASGSTGGGGSGGVIPVSGGGGGGWAPPPVYKVRLEGFDSKEIETDASGVLRREARLEITGETASLDLEKGITILSHRGQPVKAFTVCCLDAPPAAPQKYEIVRAYEFGPEGTTFDPGVTLTISYGPAGLPPLADVSTIDIAAWNGEEWELLGAVHDPEAGSVSVTLTHFSTYALVTRVLSPATFSAGPLLLDKAVVSAGNAVTGRVEITNTGDLPGDFRLVLFLDGSITESRWIPIESGETSVQDFSVRTAEPGFHELTCREQTTGFRVTEPPAAVPETSSIPDDPEKTPLPESEIESLPATTAIQTSPSVKDTDWSWFQGALRWAVPALAGILGIVVVTIFLVRRRER